VNRIRTLFVSHAYAAPVNHTGLEALAHDRHERIAAANVEFFQQVLRQ